MGHDAFDECGAAFIDDNGQDSVVISANVEDGVRVAVVGTVETVFEFVEVLRFCFGQEFVPDPQAGFGLRVLLPEGAYGFERDHVHSQIYNIMLFLSILFSSHLTRAFNKVKLHRFL